MESDPEYFLRDILGARPYPKQIEMMLAIRDHRRVSVVGCNSSGKDWTAGRAVLWWLCSRSPAKVIVTGPTTRQVADIVWNEIRAAFRNTRYPIGGRLYDSPRWQFSEDHFAVGFSTDNPYNLQGYHSPNLLVVVTEAHAVKSSDINGLRRLNPSCMLMTGNPFATAGEFYDSHHAQRELYATIQISAFDTPNILEGHEVIPGMVTVQDIEDRKDEWGEDSPLYVAGVLGEFPDSLDDTIVPLWAATGAVKRQSEVQGDVTLACDVARFGRDKTVVFRREGAVARIVWRVQGRDTMKIAGWLQNYVNDNDVATLVIDDTGVGGGVTDRLREVGTGNTRLVAFNGGEKAKDSDRYVNATSEAWMGMRDWFLEEDADIEQDPALIGQLTTRGFSYQSDRRIIIESKSKMLKSPDEADALAMTFAPSGGMPNVRWIE